MTFDPLLLICAECTDGHCETCYARRGDGRWCPCLCGWVLRRDEE